jgi:hypothetical protein
MKINPYHIPAKTTVSLDFWALDALVPLLPMSSVVGASKIEPIMLRDKNVVAAVKLILAPVGSVFVSHKRCSWHIHV